MKIRPPTLKPGKQKQGRKMKTKSQQLLELKKNTNEKKPKKIEIKSIKPAKPMCTNQQPMHEL